MFASFFTLISETLIRGDFNYISNLIQTSMISSSLINVLMFNIVPYAKFTVYKLIFYRSWTPWVTKKRLEIFKRTFGEYPKDMKEVVTIKQFS